MTEVSVPCSKTTVGEDDKLPKAPVWHDILTWEVTEIYTYLAILKRNHSNSTAHWYIPIRFSSYPPWRQHHKRNLPPTWNRADSIRSLALLPFPLPLPSSPRRSRSIILFLPFSLPLFLPSSFITFHCAIRMIDGGARSVRSRVARRRSRCPRRRRRRRNERRIAVRIPGCLPRAALCLPVKGCVGHISIPYHMFTNVIASRSSF